MQISKLIAESLFASEKDAPTFNEREFEIDAKYDFRTEASTREVLLRL